MNVDRAPGQFAAQIVGQDLHVAGQHHQLGALGFDHFILPGLGLRLGG